MTATRKQDADEKRIFRRDESRRYKALSNKKDGARPVSTLHYRVLQTGYDPFLHCIIGFFRRGTPRFYKTVFILFE